MPREIWRRWLASRVSPPVASRTRTRCLRFHGVFAPNHHLREEVVPELADDELEASCVHGQGDVRDSRPRLTWALLMKRVFAIDVLECPRCGSRMQLISFITSPPIIQKILRSVGLPTDSPPIHPARTDELLDPAA